MCRPVFIEADFTWQLKQAAHGRWPSLSHFYPGDLDTLRVHGNHAFIVIVTSLCSRLGRGFVFATFLMMLTVGMAVLILVSLCCLLTMVLLVGMTCRFTMAVTFSWD